MVWICVSGMRKGPFELSSTCNQMRAVATTFVPAPTSLGGEEGAAAAVGVHTFM